MRKMKDSGIEWIGEIPKNWELARLKDIAANETYSIVDGPFGTAISTSDYQDSGVPLVRIVNLNQTELKTDNFVYITEEHAEKLSRSRFYVEDIIFAKTGATVGKCAYNSNVKSGILSSSCVKIRISDNYYRKYYYYFFNTNQFNEALRMACNGTTRDTINLKPFACLNCLLPSYSEQQAISAHLDKQCAHIDNIIEKTKASIEEYKKLRQAVITQAVTKGVRGDRPMKDSGIEWIGEIPEKWHFIKITRMLSDNHPYPMGDGDHGLVKTDDYRDEGVPYLRVQNLGWGTELLLDNVVYITEEKNEQIKNSTLRPNDILFAKTGATIGKTGIIPESLPISNTTSHIGKITLSEKYCPRFVFYVLSSPIGYKQFWQLAIQKTTRPELSIDETKSIKVLIPDTYDEQEEIVAYLDEKCKSIDNIISKKEQFLTELESYKKSMIYEYVTGKKEVPQS